MSNDLLDENLLGELPPQIVSHIETLARMRKDFVANVSHELRTPLTVVSGYLEALLDQHDSEATPIYKKMYTQTLRMQHIIEDLLTLSRIETSEVLPVDDAPVDVPGIVQTILQHAEPLLEEKQQQVSTTLDKQLTIVGKPEELHSLFSNLIYNAIKYTPKQGRITITWRQVGQEAVFAVKDTGIGIAKKYIPRLTERFYRVDKGRSRESGGTGLGLAICKHILIRHNAELQIESEEGKGSEFCCLFPF